MIVVIINMVSPSLSFRVYFKEMIFIASLLLQIYFVSSFNADVENCLSQDKNQDSPTFKFQVDDTQNADVPCSWIYSGRSLNEVFARRSETCDVGNDFGKDIRKFCPHSCGKCCATRLRKESDRDRCHKSQICTNLMDRDLMIQENSKPISIFYEGILSTTDASKSIGTESFKESLVNELNKFYKVGIVGCDYEYNTSPTQDNVFGQNSIVGVDFASFENLKIQKVCNDYKSQEETRSCVEIKGGGSISFVTQVEVTLEMMENLVAIVQQYFDDVGSIIESNIDEVHDIELTFTIPPPFECDKIKDSSNLKNEEIMLHFEGARDINMVQSLQTMNKQLCPTQRRNLMADFSVDANDSGENLDLSVVAVKLQSLEKQNPACMESKCTYVAKGSVYFTGGLTDNSALISGTELLLLNAQPIESLKVTLTKSLLPDSTSDSTSDSSLDNTQSLTAKKGNETVRTYLLLGGACVAVQVALFVAFHKRLVNSRQQKETEEVPPDEMSTGAYIVTSDDSSSENDKPIDVSKKMSGTLGCSSIFVSFPLRNFNSFHDEDPMDSNDDSFNSDEFSKTYNESNIECIAKHDKETKSLYRGSGIMNTILWGRRGRG